MDPTDTGNLPPNAYENITHRLIAVVISLVVVDLVVVGLRFYVRLRIMRNFDIDDWFLGVTMLSTVGAAAGATSSTKFGLGGHIYVLSLPERSRVLKLIFFAAIGYHATIMLLKATFLLQFRRVFPLPSFQRLCNIFLGFISIWMVAGIVVAIAICQPISRSWDPLAPDRICKTRMLFWLVHGIMHVVTDLLIFIMPLPLLKTLPLPLLHKIVLIGVFCLGFFTCAISAIRLTTVPASLMDEDATWTMAPTLLWSVGEVTCAILCLCIPTLRPLVPRCRELLRKPRRDVEEGHPSRRSMFRHLHGSTQVESNASSNTMTRSILNHDDDSVRRGSQGWEPELELHSGLDRQIPKALSSSGPGVVVSESPREIVE